MELDLNIAKSFVNIFQSFFLALHENLFNKNFFLCSEADFAQ